MRSRILSLFFSNFQSAYSIDRNQKYALKRICNSYYVLNLYRQKKESISSFKMGYERGIEPPEPRKEISMSFSMFPLTCKN